MDLRVLEYFLAVVESGNVSKAAQKLHLTQPTLTRQLQQLEEIYGTRLFIRGSRQITLTNSGIILKRRAKEMLDLQDKTAAEIRKEFGNTRDIWCWTGYTWEELHEYAINRGVTGQMRKQMIDEIETENMK